MFVSFLNFLSDALECPIYKASGTLARQIEIFLYGDEYRKSTNTIHDIQGGGKILFATIS